MTDTELQAVGGKKLYLGNETVWNFGWIPHAARSEVQHAAEAVAQSEMPRFSAPPHPKGNPDRALLYETWKHPLVVEANGVPFSGIHQLTGSCLPSHAPVRMADGSEKVIADIRVGERVVSHTGASREVLGVQRKRTKERMRKIRVRGWSDRLYCTDKHLLPVWNGSDIDWRPAEDVLPEDLLLVGFGTTKEQSNTIDVLDWIEGCDLSEISHYKYYKGGDVSPTHRRTSALASAAKKRGILGQSLVTVRRSRLDNVIPRYVPVTSAFARWVGLYLAEGCSSDSRVTFTLSSKEEDLANELVQLTRGIWGLEARVCRTPSRPSVLTVRIPSKVLVKFIRAFIPGKSYEKRVPPVFFSSSAQVKKSLIGGWFDGDGYAKPHTRGLRITGVSASKGMVRDMGQLALSCGVPTSTASRKARNTSKESAELAMWPAMARSIPSDKLSALPTIGKELKTCSRMTPYGMACRVVSNEALCIPEDYVYDIEVDQDHSFMAWGFVVHNCVGAGGGNCWMTLACIEAIQKGDPEVPLIPFWLLPYGRSRYYLGDRSPGEGSTGGTFAKAAREDGVVPAKSPGLPSFTSDDGHVWGQSVEMKWSDGDNPDTMALLPESRKHLVKTTAKCNSADDVRAALLNGYPCTAASMYAHDGGRVQGSPAVLLASKQGSWSHQMSILAWLLHPEFGELFWLMNQWGLRAHGQDPFGGPAGGVWIRKADVDWICRDEVFAFSQFDGFPAQDLPLTWIF